MNQLVRRTLIGIAVGIVVYAVAILYSDFRALEDTLAAARWWGFLGALGCSSINYLLRFSKWELCLGWLAVRAPGPGNAESLSLLRSLLIYLAGLSMSVTPGKLGEVLRSGLLKATDGIPFARTAPIVVADRLTDLIALLALTIIGLSSVPEAVPYAIFAGFLIVSGAIVLGSPKLMHWSLDLLANLGPLANIPAKIRQMVDSSAILLAPRRLFWLTLISIVGWGLECVGYMLILEDFAGVTTTFETCAFLWASTTLIGALSFMPGGLGATEMSLGLLAARLLHGVTQPIALASTLLIRVATLWFGEAVGAIALLILMRDPRVRGRTELQPEHNHPTATS